MQRKKEIFAVEMIFTLLFIARIDLMGPMSSANASTNDHRNEKRESGIPKVMKKGNKKNLFFCCSRWTSKNERKMASRRSGNRARVSQCNRSRTSVSTLEPESFDCRAKQNERKNHEEKKNERMKRKVNASSNGTHSLRMNANHWKKRKYLKATKSERRKKRTRNKNSATE